MSETGRVETLFSGGAEAPELENYRPLSPLAVIACLAALASSLAVVHPLLWIIPVVAAALAVSAIVRLSSPHSRYGGRSAAIAALCLAALIGSYAPARTFSRDRQLYAEARSKIDEWLALVQQGRVHEAHQLSQDPSARYAGPASLATYYAKVALKEPPSDPTGGLGAPPGGVSPPAMQLEEFLRWPAVAKLLELGDQARIEHLQNVEIRVASGNLKIIHRYRIEGGPPDSEGVEFRIAANRQEDENLATWTVGEFGSAE
jgi:hypothetical protein